MARVIATVVPLSVKVGATLFTIAIPVVVSPRSTGLSVSGLLLVLLCEVPRGRRRRPVVLGSPRTLHTANCFWPSLTRISGCSFNFSMMDSG